MVESKKEIEYLSLDDILSAEDCRYVEVSAWGGKLRLGSLTAGQMLDHIETVEGPAKRTSFLRLIIQSLVDGKGKHIGDIKKLDALKNKDLKTCNMVADAVLELNGMANKKLNLSPSEASQIRALLIRSKANQLGDEDQKLADQFIRRFESPEEASKND